MARIRTIKPEFPQSESTGRISRETRLCFILLWTLADDEGRLRGHSRMLASLLYPYDDDARGLIDGWLDELEREHCIVRYQVDGESYLQICNWLKHQKIDRPTKSKFPSPPQSLASPRESSRNLAQDQGPKDQGKDQGVRFKLEDFDCHLAFESLCSVYSRAERSQIAQQRYLEAIEWCVEYKKHNRKEAAAYISDRAVIYCKKSKFQKGLTKWLEEKIFEQSEAAWSDTPKVQPITLKNPADELRRQLEAD